MFLAEWSTIVQLKADWMKNTPLLFWFFFADSTGVSLLSYRFYQLAYYRTYRIGTWLVMTTLIVPSSSSTYSAPCQLDRCVLVHFSIKRTKAQTNVFCLYYAPQRSWGKVIFSVACVKGRYPPSSPREGTPPWAGTPPMVNERAVRIQLECILVAMILLESKMTDAYPVCNTRCWGHKEQK